MDDIGKEMTNYKCIFSYLGPSVLKSSPLCYILTNYRLDLLYIVAIFRQLAFLKKEENKFVCLKENFKNC